MKLEQQVVSLELAKKLKELGVDKECLFFWGRTWGEAANGKPDTSSAPAQYELTSKLNRSQELWGDGYIPAFTVAELGHVLPVLFDSGATRFEEANKKWCCHWYEVDKYTGVGIDENNTPSVYAATEADARAKMLIYLIENGLVDKQVHGVIIGKE